MLFYNAFKIDKVEISSFLFSPSYREVDIAMLPSTIQNVYLYFSHTFVSQLFQLLFQYMPISEFSILIYTTSHIFSIYSAFAHGLVLVCSYNKLRNLSESAFHFSQPCTYLLLKCCNTGGWKRVNKTLPLSQPATTLACTKLLTYNHHQRHTNSQTSGNYHHKK